MGWLVSAALRARRGRLSDGADAVEERAPGIGIVNVTFAGTGAVVVTSVAASLLPATFGLVHAALSCVLFAVGTGALLWAYALGVSRSRTDAAPLRGPFFLADGPAPPHRRPPVRALGTPPGRELECPDANN